jgi:signal transduction histidine kinase
VAPIVENGSIAGTQSTIRDITDRKLTEDVLRLLSTGVAHLSGAEFFNEIAARTAQLLDAEIGFVGRLLPDAEPRIRTLGRSVDGELLPPVEYDPAGTPCERVMGNEACIVPDGVQELFPADRHLSDMSASAYAGVPLLDRDEVPVGHVGVMSRRPFEHPERVEAALRLVAVRAAAEIERVRVEEERAALEAHLRAAQKMEAIGTLAGGIAHDFNNILTAIIGNTELAAMDIGTHHPALGTIDEIRLASTRAKALVSQILTFSQRREQPQTAVALRPLVEEVVHLLKVALPPNAEVVTRFGDGAPAVLADPTQMHQVLMNLCTNAWQAMDGEPGRIEIHLDEVTLDAAAARLHAGLRAGRHARLMVSDTGKGMDAATIERIFEPFFTMKRAGQGTGLGLAVAHGIVRAHGGAIAVRSQPGGGSVFEVYLPVRVADQAATLQGAPALPRGAGQHLLYLDDEPALVRVTARILETMGYRVTGFTDAAEALAALGANPGRFDAVLTDLSMPGASGLDVIRDVSRLRPGIPIALTSGFATDEVHASAKALGCREVINKPASIEDIANALHRLFSAD